MKIRVFTLKPNNKDVREDELNFKTRTKKEKDIMFNELISK